MKVTKFGGSSLASASQLKKVLDIIKDDPERRFVVVSAPGKRNAEDTKVTDALIRYYKEFTSDKDVTQTQQWIIERYRAITEELGLKESIIQEIAEDIYDLTNLPKKGNPFTYDAFLAAGENNNAKLIAAYFNQNGLEARYIHPKEAGITVTAEPSNARILPSSYDKIEELKDSSEVIVVPGFFGVTQDGDICTFSRGGSDITGSIIAAGVKADLYENFTDVDAIYVASPKIVHKPLAIDVLSYTEMRELSYAGFSVFHTEALLPSIKKGIPVHVCNTNNPEASGTYIMQGKVTSPSVISGIASSPGFVSIYVKKYLMNHEIGFLRKVLTIFEEEGISIEHIPTGIDDATIIIRGEDATDEQLDGIVERFYAELDVDDAHYMRGLCLIMLVGEGMVNMVGTTARVASTLARTQINIELYNQGVSEVSMMFGILDQYEKKAIRALYDEFFGETKEYKVVE